MTDDDRLISKQDGQLYLRVLREIYVRVEAFRAASGSTDLHGIEFGALQLSRPLALPIS
jgi:hypothetical protein